MVKDHSDNEKGNPLSPHRLLFPINSKDSTYHGLCYTSRGGLAGTRNSSIGPPHMKDRSDDPSHHERTLLTRSYISLLINLGINLSRSGGSWDQFIMVDPSSAPQLVYQRLKYAFS